MERVYVVGLLALLAIELIVAVVRYMLIRQMFKLTDRRR